jgi:hypothetical protein
MKYLPLMKMGNRAHKLSLALNGLSTSPGNGETMGALYIFIFKRALSKNMCAGTVVSRQVA